MQVWSLGQEDPLENGMATHSSILTWRLLMVREAWCVTVCRVKKSNMAEATKHTCIYDSQDVETTWKFIDWGMDKEYVVHLYNRILLTHKENEIMPFAAALVYLEIVILSEVRQTVRQISNDIAYCCCLVSKLCLTLLQPHGAFQDPLFMGFSRQVYWSGLSFLSLGIFLTQGSNPCFLHLLLWQMDSLPLSNLESPIFFTCEI